MIGQKHKEVLICSRSSFGRFGAVSAAVAGAAAAAVIAAAETIADAAATADAESGNH